MKETVGIKLWEGAGKALRRVLPPAGFYFLRQKLDSVRELIFGQQLMMRLSSEVKIPELRLLNDYTIVTFKDFPDIDSWVRIVNGLIGDWTAESATYLFFGDKYFIDDLCLFMFHRDRPVATASGRIRRIGGKLTGEIHMIAVIDEARGNNIGLTLSNAVIHRIRATFDGAEIILRTDDWRLPAIKQYWKLGFRPVDRIGRADHRKPWSSIKGKLGL